MSHLPWAERFATYARSLHDSSGAPGMAVGLSVGTATYLQSCGERDREAGLPVTAHTIFGLASVTKSFTAVAVLQLQEAGRLSVHDPVVRWLPEFRTPDPAHTQAVTLHHLLTHTAGLPPLSTWLRALARSTWLDPDCQESAQGRGLAQVAPIDTYAQLVAAIAAEPFELIAPPGQQLSYSNDGYALLGEVIARASGLPYEAYITRHILQPAGMTRSCFAPPTPPDGDLVTLYDSSDARGIFPSPNWRLLRAFSATGGLCATAADMLRYLELFRTGGLVQGVRLLASESVQAMLTPHAPTAGGQRGGNAYGYGIQVYPGFHGTTLYGHAGGLKGVASYILVLPEHDLAAVGLSNLMAAPTTRLTQAAAAAALGADPAAPSFVYPTAPAGPLAAYVGDYRSDEDFDPPTPVRRTADALTLEGLPLRPVGPDTFVTPADLLVRFLRRETGTVWALFRSNRVIRRLPV